MPIGSREDGSITVGLDLRPEHEHRYQEIRRRREAIEADD